MSVKAIKSFYSVYFHPAELPIELALPSTVSDKIIQYLNSQDLKIGKCIGRGRQGAVYKLENRITGKTTNILKVSYSWRFEQSSSKEGPHLTAKLKHPNLCTPKKLFYLSKTQDLIFSPAEESVCVGMIMPFIQGITLKEKYQEITDSAERIFSIGEQLSSAIHELYENNLAHIDLHDENILVDADFNSAIIDFDRCQISMNMSRADYKRLLDHLWRLIRSSQDIRPNSKQFIQGCLNKCYKILFYDTVWTTNPSSELPKLMISFMQACKDHLHEIQVKPVSRL